MIYVRVSTKEQVDEGNSLITQQKICLDYAKSHNYDVIETFIEQGESAKTANRTELQRLLSHCADKKNGIKAVIIYKLDRLSRNTDDYSQLRLLLKRYGVEIKSTSEHFENNPVGRFMENTMANIAQFDNDIRTERSVGGMKEAVQEGRYVWTAPVGYKNVKIGGRATITPDEVTAPLIRRAFELVATNIYTTEQVRQIITKEGLLNRQGKPYFKGYFYKFLSNELYTGWINKFGEKHRGKFPPIVSEELFNQAQRILRCKGRKHASYLVNHPDFPLRKFVFNELGQRLTGAWTTGRTKKYPYYRFKGKNSNHKKEVLEQAFMAYLNTYQLNEKNVRRLNEIAQEELVFSTRNQRKEVERLKESIKDINVKQTGLLRKNLEGVISDDLLKQQLEFIDQELIEINALLARISISDTDFTKIPGVVESFLKNPSVLWENSVTELKTQLQWFQFPKGLTFQKNIFRTAEMCCLFKAKDALTASFSTRVDSKKSGLKLDNKFWLKFASECEYLSKLLADKQLKAADEDSTNADFTRDKNNCPP